MKKILIKRYRDFPIEIVVIKDGQKNFEGHRLSHIYICDYDGSKNMHTLILDHNKGIIKIESLFNEVTQYENWLRESCNKTKKSAKKLITVLSFLFLSSFLSAQDFKSFYYIAKVDAIKFDEKDNTTFAGSLTVGVSANDYLSFGIGAQVMKFKNDNSVYAPFFLHASYLPNKDNPVLYLSGKIGVGLYNNIEFKKAGTIEEVTQTKGGLYLSPSIGIVLPGSGTGAVFTLSYINSAFWKNVKTTVGTVHTESEERYNLHGASLGIGIKF